LVELASANSFTLAVIGGAIAATAAAAPGQSVTVPGIVFRKLALPQTLHRKPGAADEDHACNGREKSG
jgi:hypothetical protein